MRRVNRDDLIASYRSRTVSETYFVRVQIILFLNDITLYNSLYLLGTLRMFHNRVDEYFYWIKSRPSGGDAFFVIIDIQIDWYFRSSRH